ncbi:protein SCO1/2 [Mesobacillus persicus]|uniref:Protein SCO1/2 n=1 Tax=Mesobacillus persicus TaxID=930146 RepID=A0A1H7VRX9_9BACI|nr:SCO family protein [Mesobacillus persicus]SEM11991.1 protein SCO1/2 [Mesobacillus persicus]
MRKKVSYVLISLIILAIGIFALNKVLSTGKEMPVLDEAVPFVMKDAYHESYDSNNQKVKLLAFFYTNCPDICPLTMMDFSLLQQGLQESDLFGTEVELVAITLDPEVDTYDVIKDYAKNFNANRDGWRFLRGSPEETKRIADSFHMKYKKVEGDYIAHNTTMFLIDQNNKIRGLYDMANAKERVDTEEIMKSIEKLVQSK